MNKKIFLSLMIALTMIFAAACNTETPETANEGAKVVVDMLGREVSFDSVPEKVIAVTPSNAEILYALGAEDTLVGRGSYVDYPEEVMDVPAVESGDNLNAEQILALEPDLILMSDMAQTEEQINTLTQSGAKVVMTDSKNLEEVYESINLIGNIMGKSQEAETVVRDMKNIFSEISANSEANKGKSVYFEISPLEYGLWTAGNNTFMQEIASAMGLRNIFEDVNEFGEVSEEQILDRNPDYIVTITMYSGAGPQPVDEIKSRPGWENINAVQNDNILNLDNNELSRPGPRLAEGAQILSDFVSE